MRWPPAAASPRSLVRETGTRRSAGGGGAGPCSGEGDGEAAARDEEEARAPGARGGAGHHMEERLEGWPRWHGEAEWRLGFRGTGHGSGETEGNLGFVFHELCVYTCVRGSIVIALGLYLTLLLRPVAGAMMKTT